MSIFNKSEPYPYEKINDLNKQINILEGNISKYEQYEFSFEKWRELNIKVIRLQEAVNAQAIVLERILKKIQA